MRRSQLEAVYRRAIYRVSAGRAGRAGRIGRGQSPEEAIDLRIGRRSAALDALLARHRATTWAFLTAVNPGSKRLDDDENRRRTRRLTAALARRGWPRRRGTGIDPAGRWPPEPSFLVLDADPDALVALASRYGQAAFVAGEVGRPARLVWLDSTMEAGERRTPRSRSSAGARAPR